MNETNERTCQNCITHVQGGLVGTDTKDCAHNYLAGHNYFAFTIDPYDNLAKICGNYKERPPKPKKCCCCCGQEIST